MTTRQQTLKGVVSISGIGLHTGEKVNLTLHPAPVNHGYKFKRTDLEGQPVIHADVDNVVGTQRGTTLEQNGARVYTTEHLLAAVYALQVDNVLIEMDGPEVPIMDGSALPFVKAIESVGIQEQEEDAKYFVLKENISFEDTGKKIEMLAVPTPGEEYRITVMVDFNSPVLGTQHASMYKLDDFKTEISGCRTFVFLTELEQLAAAGLIKGGDLDNAIVLVERPNVPQEELDRLARILGKEATGIKVEGMGVLNNIKLQFENEPARHKLLDIVGDLALLGHRIKGHILAARPGHGGNVAFCKMLKEKIRAEQGAAPKFDLNRVVYDCNQIAAMLPHRYPFLLVDKVIDKTDETITGVKNVTFNEPFFTGHFPGNPIMPGVLQVEAMAQVGGIFSLCSVPDPELYTTYFMKIDKVKFKQKVLPGDTLVFHLRLLSPIRRGIVYMAGIAYVNGKEVMEAEMMALVTKNKI
jgi:UDP-3-O-[3-hydroxymyristoyl] N-acetylglucosamine deacetylase/3-hydroxyacyl-[acyl-carrier-protein] dehydratase